MSCPKTIRHNENSFWISVANFVKTYKEFYQINHWVSATYKQISFLFCSVIKCEIVQYCAECLYETNVYKAQFSCYYIFTRTHTNSCLLTYKKEGNVLKNKLSIFLIFLSLFLPQLTKVLWNFFFFLFRLWHNGQEKWIANHL